MKGSEIMEKNNKRLMILIAILCVLILGLVFYITYDKISDVEKNENFVTDNKNELLDNERENSYKVFANNLNSQFSKFDSNNYCYKKVESNIVDGGYSVWLDKDGNLFIKYFKDELNNLYGDYKIADKVLSFYIITSGNGGGNVLYFINSDGSVSQADVEYGIGNSNSIDVTNIGYKNIVTIIEGTFGDGNTGVHGAIFIDIDGNIFSKNLK